MISFDPLPFPRFCKLGTKQEGEQHASAASGAIQARGRGSGFFFFLRLFSSHNLSVATTIPALPTPNQLTTPKKNFALRNVSARSKALSGKDRIRSARAPLALFGRGHRRGGRRGPDRRHVRVGVAGRYNVVGVVGGHRARLGGVGRGPLVSLLVVLRGLVSRKTTVPTTTRRRFFRSMIGRSATTGAARRGGKEFGGKELERAKRSPAKLSMLEFFLFVSHRVKLDAPIPLVQFHCTNAIQCDALTHRDRDLGERNVEKPANEESLIATFSQPPSRR